MLPIKVAAPDVPVVVSVILFCFAAKSDTRFVTWLSAICMATEAAAVVKPFALTVCVATLEAEPNEPTFELTVASVVALLLFAVPLNPLPALVTSPVRVPIVRDVVKEAADPVVFWLNVGKVFVPEVRSLFVMTAEAEFFVASDVLSTFPSPTSPLTRVTAPVFPATDVTGAGVGVTHEVS